MILIIDMNERKLGFDEFVLPIVSIIKKNYFVKHYKKVKKGDLEKCSKVIISGTPLKDLDYVNHLDYFEWIKDFDKPILGICAGMQAIGLVYGCSLVKCKEIGMQEIKTLKENKLFSSKFQAYTLHSNAIKPTKEFEILAKSKKCVEAIKHKQKETYGVLFHPEVRNKEIITKFI